MASRCAASSNTPFWESKKARSDAGLLFCAEPGGVTFVTAPFFRQKEKEKKIKEVQYPSKRATSFLLFVFFLLTKNYHTRLP